MNTTQKYHIQDTLLDNYAKFFYIHDKSIIIFIITSIIVDYFTLRNYLLSSFTFFIITLWTYVIHRLFHSYPDTFGILHHTHHMDNSNMILCIFDNIFNFFTIGGAILLIPLMYIKNKWNIYLLNPFVILIWSLVYSTYHTINYHVLEMNSTHREHHEELTYNYGPEWFDIMFYTKKEDSNIEDMNSGIFNIIVVSSIILCILYMDFEIFSQIKTP